MFVFFDTEFTGLYRGCKLISIGLVNQDYTKTFYWEINKEEWFDDVKDNNWLLSNVVTHLKFVKANEPFVVVDYDSQTGVTHTEGYGDMDALRRQLTKWLELEEDQYIQLVSDVCHYDMTLFIDIFGTAFDIPEFVSPACYDINQDIARHLGITCREAFDISREDFVGVAKNGVEKLKHNALWDALIIRECYNKIHE